MSIQPGARESDSRTESPCTPIRLEPMPADAAIGLATAFKALGDPVRLRMLSLIASHPSGEACVCDITEHFDLAQPTISHHLKMLRTAGLITGERRGSWVYYRFERGMLERLARVLDVPAVPA